MEEKKKVHIKTFGCQMNVYDSARIADLLQNTHSMLSIGDPEDADLLVMNTCAIREKASERFFSELGRWRELKQENPNAVIAVGGCVASQQGEDIWRRAPFVDIVFGPQTLHRLPAMYTEVMHSRRLLSDVSFPAIEKFDALPSPSASGVSAFLSIMEGCSKYCSFCVVPYTRGTEVSRPFDDVLKEATELATIGVREIILLGQNVNAYRGKMHTGQVADLALLIEYIAAIDQIARIRFTTSHPVEMTAPLIAVYGTVDKLASHLHLPVQSGSDQVLARMKRRYTASQYTRCIRAVRRVRPGIAVSSDFIVGFPGESDEDFEATLRLVTEIGFDQSYAFTYSPRPGTPAALFADPVPETLKAERLYCLQQLLAQQVAQRGRDMIGTVQSVLVERFSRKDDKEMNGCTSGNRRVNFSVPMASSPHAMRNLIGQVVDVRILAVHDSSLRGECVQDASFFSGFPLHVFSESATGKQA